MANFVRLIPNFLFLDATLMKNFLLITILATLVLSAEAIPPKRIDRGITKQTFIPKGQIFAGGTLTYFQTSSDDFQVLMIDGLQGDAYNAGGRVMFGYAFANDVAAGVSFAYTRTMVKIDDVDIKLSEDMVFSIKDYYSLQHVYTGTAFLRTYINIGNSKRFGLFNDVRFNFGGGQGRIMRGAGEAMQGTYEKIQKIGPTLSPGLAVFVTDFMAIEASIGILGVGYNKTEQITNQVYQGSFETFSADFKINLLSVGLGISFYF